MYLAEGNFTHKYGLDRSILFDGEFSKSVHTKKGTNFLRLVPIGLNIVYIVLTGTVASRRNFYSTAQLTGIRIFHTPNRD
jgi:hypothetical protein